MYLLSVTWQGQTGERWVNTLTEAKHARAKAIANGASKVVIRALKDDGSLVIVE